MDLFTSISLSCGIISCCRPSLAHEWRARSHKPFIPSINSWQSMQHKGQLWWQPYPQVAPGWIPAAETQTRRWDAADHSLYISQGSWLKKNREWPVRNDPWLCHHRYRAIPMGQVSVCICCDHSALFTSDLGSNTLVLQYAYCLLLSASSEVIFRHNMWQTILRDY